MIQILHYEIVNGTKSDKIPYDKIVKDKEELQKLRRYLEEINQCWEERKLITGIERKKVKEILFTYKE